VVRDRRAAAIAARLRAEIAAARNELAIEIDANLRAATPVDTGHARANWVPSIGSPAMAEVEGSAAHDAGVVAVRGAKLTDDVYVSNNAPYLGRLIGGSSAQAPAGWDLEAIDRAVQAVQQRHDGLSIDVSAGGTGATVTITPRATANEDA